LLTTLQAIFSNSKVPHSTVQSNTSYRKTGCNVLRWIGILVPTAEDRSVCQPAIPL